MQIAINNSNHIFLLPPKKSNRSWGRWESTKCTHWLSYIDPYFSAPAMLFLKLHMLTTIVAVQVAALFRDRRVPYWPIEVLRMAASSSQR